MDNCNAEIDALLAARKNGEGKDWVNDKEFANAEHKWLFDAVCLLLRSARRGVDR